MSSHFDFKETPGMFVYCVTKHAIIGLLRTLRLYVPKAFPGVRVNVVSPSMTKTHMVDGVLANWINDGLPVNQPEDIASAVAGLMVAGPGTRAVWINENDSPGFRAGDNAGGMDWEDTNGYGVHGRTLFVLGGRCYDIEERLDRTEQDWTGKNINATVKKTQAALRDGSGWLKGSH